MKYDSFLSFEKMIVTQLCYRHDAQTSLMEDFGPSPESVSILPRQQLEKLGEYMVQNLMNLWSGVLEHVKAALCASPGQVSNSRRVWLQVTKTVTRWV